MAAVSQVIGASPYDGTSMSINYDDQTLLASGLTFVVSKSLAAPLIVNAVVNSVGFTWQAPPSSHVGTYTFSPPLQGTLISAPPKGGPAIVEFNVTSFQFGTVGVTAVSGNQVIHV